MRNNSSKSERGHKVAPAREANPLNGSTLNPEIIELKNLLKKSDDMLETAMREYLQECRDKEALQKELQQLKFQQEKVNPELKTVALNTSQILLLQQIITDLFEFQRIGGWKDDIQAIFTGWVTSKEFEALEENDKSNIIYTYHQVIKLFESLNQFFPTIAFAYQEQEGLPNTWKQ